MTEQRSTPGTLDLHERILASLIRRRRKAAERGDGTWLFVSEIAGGFGIGKAIVSDILQDLADNWLVEKSVFANGVAWRARLPESPSP